jgi:hypothetical protein
MWIHIFNPHTRQRFWVIQFVFTDLLVVSGCLFTMYMDTIVLIYFTSPFSFAKSVIQFNCLHFLHQGISNTYSINGYAEVAQADVCEVLGNCHREKSY